MIGTRLTTIIMKSFSDGGNKNLANKGQTKHELLLGNENKI